MKNIRADKRSSMSNELLDDLLVINVDKVNIEEFKADHSIDLWWRSKTRRPNQTARKVYEKGKKSKAQVAPASTLIQVTVRVTVIS